MIIMYIILIIIIIVGRYVAIKDYEAEEYLSLRKGDMIEVLQGT